MMLGKTNSMVQGGGVDMTRTPIAAFYGHVNTGNAWDVPTNYIKRTWNDKYFSYSNGVFTTKKACVVDIIPIMNQKYNQSTGSSNKGTCELRINDTSIWSDDRDDPTKTNAFATQTVTLNVGDTVQYRCHGSTTAIITGGMFIRLST